MLHTFLQNDTCLTTKAKLKSDCLGEAEITQSIKSSADYVNDLQSLLKSLQEEKTPTTSSDHSKFWSGLSWTTVNDSDIPPTMVNVAPMEDRRPSLESIKYINSKSALREKQKVLVSKLSKVSKLQYSFKPSTVVPTVSTSVLKTPTNPTLVSKPKLLPITANPVISVPLTFPSKGVLQLTPGQTGITMTAKATSKLTSSNTLKLLANKCKSPAVQKPAFSPIVVPIKNVSGNNKAVSKPTLKGSQCFSVKVLNPTKLQNGTPKLIASKNNDATKETLKKIINTAGSTTFPTVGMIYNLFKVVYHGS